MTPLTASLTGTWIWFFVAVLVALAVVLWADRRDGGER